MSATERQSCPPAESIAAFVDGRLPAAQRTAMITHSSSCAACRTEIAFASAYHDEDAQDTSISDESHRFSAWRWIAIAAAVALCIALGPLLRSWRASASRDAAMSRLSSAAGAQPRSVTARLNGFAWTPMRSVARGGTGGGTTSITAAAADVVRLSERSRNPRAQHAVAIAELLAGDAADAVARLQEATAASPNQPELWGDLSAALYTEGETTDDAAVFRAAVAAADCALRLDPGDSAARFNRALSLEASHRDAEAIAAWRQYLAEDHASGWSGEAATHLARLTSSR